MSHGAVPDGDTWEAGTTVPTPVDLPSELAAGATAEADQLKAELAVTAAGAAFYYRRLKREGVPEALARTLVIGWQTCYLSAGNFEEEL